MVKLIGYVRVSTEKQGESGLGLEAQLSALREYARSVGGEIVAIYREVETGKDSGRPEIAKAIAHAKRVRGRLVIAKLDRLARNVHFTSGLMESGVDFVSCESPNDDRFIIHIKAAVAEEEARKISQRTKAALAAAKARGTLLGSARPDHWQGREDRREAGALKGAKVSKARRDAEAEPVYRAAIGIIAPMVDEGASLREMVEELNDAGLTTVRGLPWNAMQVSRLIKSRLFTTIAATLAAGALSVV